MAKTASLWLFALPERNAAGQRTGRSLECSYRLAALSHWIVKSWGQGGFFRYLVKLDVSLAMPEIIGKCDSMVWPSTSMQVLEFE